MNQKEKQQDHMIYLTRRTFEPSGEPMIPPTNKLEYYIVQFKEPLTSEDREQLRRKYGLRLDTYIPNFAFLERMNSQTFAALSDDPLYRAIARYQPSDKISPELDRAGADSSERLGLNERLIRVFLFSHVEDKDIRKVAEAIDSLRAPFMIENRTDADTQTLREGDDEPGEQDSVERPSAIRFDPAEIRTLNDRDLGGQAQLVFVLPSTELLPKIAQLDEVQWIEEVVKSTPDSAIVVNCPGSNTVAGTIQSGDPSNTPIWAHCINGNRQKIGIIDDSLLDIGHCMFRDTNATAGMAHRKVVGFRRFLNDGDIEHGTRVAAIALGDEFGNSGNNENRGIAWLARLSYDDQRAISNGRRSMLQVLADEVCIDGAMIHSNSWHDITKLYNKTAEDVDTFVWNNEKHFVCGSSGNNGEDLGPPGTAKNALCVSASRGFPRHSEHGDGPSGPTPRPDARRKPEICAPGCGINAADGGTGCGCMPLLKCESSFATPVIAGAAALVRQYYEEGFHHAGVQDLSRPGDPSGALIKATLLNATVPMEDKKNYPNNKTGWGLIKLDNTLFFAGGHRKLFVEDVLNANGLDTGQSRSHNITVRSQDEPLKITLVWSDPPAKRFASKIPIHDLNLIVTSRDGKVYLGNVNFVSGFSQPMMPASVPDAVNNVEMVIIDKPMLGPWTITIECVAASMSKQGYALVATGSL